MPVFAIFFLLLATGRHNCKPVESPQAKWNSLAQDDLNASLKLRKNTNVAKNVILFLGDGLSLPTIFASRVYKGQKNGQSGEEGSLSFENFPYNGLAKTYNVDRQVSDSSGTAAAFLCGVKTNYGIVALDERMVRGDCQSYVDNPERELSCITNWSIDEGKDVGVVTTTRITHATPANAYAKCPNRSWEAYVPADADGKCQDIAQQVINRARNFKVLMGGGRKRMTPTTEADPEYPQKTGDRKDGRNLIQEWIKQKQNAGVTYRYVWNLTDFDSVDPTKTDFLLGLFDHSHMQYELNRASDIAGEPSLAQMTRKAIEILRKNDKGFFLLVEGGRIDHGHHAGKAHHALADTVAMDEAVTVAMEMTSEDDTLITVTADHSHVFTVGGYPPRGAPILGFQAPPGAENKEPATDGMPYTILLYSNGPGYVSPRQNLTGVNTADKDYMQQTAVPVPEETHGGEDVPIYARGPMAHLFNGCHEQNYVAHVMAYASCVGANKQHCA